MRIGVGTVAGLGNAVEEVGAFFHVGGSTNQSPGTTVQSVVPYEKTTPVPERKLIAAGQVVPVYWITLS